MSLIQTKAKKIISKKGRDGNIFAEIRIIFIFNQFLIN